MRSITKLLVLAPIFAAVLPACAQELGTNVGIPNSSPPVLWPRGMSIEALSPVNLYPNGPQFGLSNTSGGFGVTGSGPMSGVGLSQRSVSNLVQEELNRPYDFMRRLSGLENAEALRSRSLFSTVLGSQFRIEMPRPSTTLFRDVESRLGALAPQSLPSADSVLQDRPASVDAILRTGL